MRLKRLAAPKDSLVLCMPTEPAGSVVIDTRGTWYCMVNNGYGKGGGLRRMTEEDIAMAKSLGIEPRPSQLWLDLLTEALRHHE